MKISFHGAAREVTGSCHLVECNGSRILLDCGMIQGGPERHVRNREPFPFEAARVDCVILSHAHIDHCGRLPLLVRDGFRGPILATPPTIALCRILLADSARIHQEDARWKVHRLRKRGEDHRWVRPLFTEEEAAAVLEHFVPLPFHESHELGEAGSVSLAVAGHILGAAIVEMKLTEAGVTRHLTFSGDLGPDGARLLSEPEAVSRPDYLLIESTYGDRRRPDEGDLTERLHRSIQETVRRGGKLIIPAFAVGRTQTVLARINDLVESGRVSALPVYVDSPMAVEATRSFAMYPEAYSQEARRLLRAGDRPLEFPGLKLVQSVEESKAINAHPGPCVIISASGMCTAGRIKHHLKNYISDARNTLLFVGFQAEGTLGRAILSGTSPVRIFGEWHVVGARVESIEGFSAHADLDELLAWHGSLNGNPKRTFVVHGEEAAARGLASELQTRFKARPKIPRLGQSFPLK